MDIVKIRFASFCNPLIFHLKVANLSNSPAWLEAYYLKYSITCIFIDDNIKNIIEIASKSDLKFGIFIFGIQWYY